MATRNPKFSAAGTITDANGFPVEGVQVELLLVNLRAETPLGQARTNEAGTYRIAYARAASHPVADLRIRVRDSRRGELLAVSPVLYRAPLQAVIDLALPARDAGKSGLTQLVNRLQPLLGNVKLADLREDRELRDISNLSAAIGESPLRIAQLRQAHRLEAATRISADLHFAWLDAGLPDDPAQLAILPAEQLENALQAAAAQGLLEDRGADVWKKMAAQLKRGNIAQPTGLLRAGNLFTPPGDVETSEADYVQRTLNRHLQRIILENMPDISPAGVQILQARLQGVSFEDAAGLEIREVLERQIMPTLPGDGNSGPILPPEDICKIKAHAPYRAKVGEVLELNKPLAENQLLAEPLRRAKTFAYAQSAGLSHAKTIALAERGLLADVWAEDTLRTAVEERAISAAEAKKISRIGTLSRIVGLNPDLVNLLYQNAPQNLAELVAYTPRDWQALVERNQAPLPPGFTAETYAETLAQQTEMAYPLPWFVHYRLQQEGENSLLRKFHQNNPAETWAAHDWLRGDHAGFKWTGISQANRPEVVRQLAADQRILKLAESPGQAVALRGAGFDSARSIARLSPSAFAKRSRLDDQSAGRVYARAQEASTRALHAFAAAQDVMKGGLSQVRMGNIPKTVAAELLQIEGMSALFGPEQYCDCAECRSVLSPAAYLVDMLRFLEEKMEDSPPEYAPLQLLQRRPDLAKLPLTCANTKTHIPYLTVVNEVLSAWLRQQENGDPLELAAQPGSSRGFLLPFNLPLAELRLYLSHFNLTPFDLFAALHQPDGAMAGLPAEAWPLYLQLDATDVTLITTPDEAAVLERYRMNDLSELTPMRFVRMAGIERKELSDLLDMRFYPGLKTLKIVLEPDPEVDDVQAYREVFQGMTPAHADFLYRFVRLWRKTGWTIAQLDAVLTALPTADTQITNPELLQQLSKAAWLQEQFRWNATELCAFLDKLPVSKKHPQKPDSPETRGLLEQVFDLEAIFGLTPEGNYLEETPYLRNGNDAAHARLSALLSGALKINNAELKAILEFLGGDWPGKLHRASLSLLYRHVMMARHFGWPVQEWLIAAELLEIKDPKGLSALIKLHDFSRWQKALGLLPSEIAFFQGKTIKLGGQAFGFITPEWVKSFEEVANAEPDAREAVFNAKIPEIRTRLNAGPDFWNALLAWTPTDIAQYWTPGTTLAPTKEALTQWSEEVERVLWLVQRLGWTEQAFIWLTKHPAKAKIANRRAKNINTLKGLAAWQQLMPSDPEAVAQVLKTLDVEGDAYAAWADYWKMDTEPVSEMKALLNLDADPAVPDIIRLQQVLVLGKRLGATASTLAQLSQNATYAEAKTASEIALQLIQAQYSDEKERQARVEPYTDKVNSWKRDALVQYILTRYDGGAFPFEDESSLYAYFLLDVEMEGCFRTSRIVAAHGSIQLYIHRILMNLEQSADGQFKAIEQIEDLESFKTEWEWRKNYRVWEANRKVFLYPENYLEPDLRDNKTPIFRELEEELLQRELDQESAELAWRNYFEKYTDLAELRIAGAFYEKNKNTYHFFGRTAKDPFQYYYRRWENQRLWTPWEAMDLPIPVKEVTGIVYNGQTHVFWAEVEEENGTQKVFLNMSHLRANGRWSTPQRLEYSEEMGVFNFADLQVFPAINKNAELIFNLFNGNTTIVKKYNPILNMLENILDSDAVNQGLQIPRIIDYLALQPSSTTTTNACFGNSGYFPLLPFIWEGNIFTQFLPGARTESEIDELQNNKGPIPYGNLKLTGPFKSFNTSLSHVGGTTEDSTLEIEGRRYLIQTIRYMPEIAQGPLNPPFSNLSLTKKQNVLYLSRHYHKLINIGHKPTENYPLSLSEKNLEIFLDTGTQKSPESSFPATILNTFILRPPSLDPDKMDLTGPYGDYLRELFFHIPFHIAHQMNANQQFKEAKWWYERIFDPTASGDMGDVDRPWRYIEFKGLGYAKMKETLQDTAALERYRLDPFNPHAIARLRLSAYQKTIVMKYVDNLVDWGDHLFAQYTMESINEALMMYQLATDILGERPVKMGACPEPDADALTYEKIETTDKSAWDAVLIGLENLPEQEDDGESQPPQPAPDPQSQLQPLFFCIPFNADLHEYWDRVADRLYKIRHCLDLNGQPRQIPLFAPPIDPMLLVRAKAMGLSLEQILEMVNASTPHYRFAYLIDRAKQYAQTVQAFGSALLSALNSKDAEQLTLLRSVQEREILRMGREVRKRNLEEAKAQMRAIHESAMNTKYRENYFTELIDEGLLNEEDRQKFFRNSSTILYGFEFLWRVLSGSWPLQKPDDKAERLAYVFQSLASLSGAISESFGLSATFSRRKQEWTFQRDTAAQELKQIAQQLLAAEIRVAIAEKDLEMHERSIEHADEVYAFYRDKFTNLGLFNFMSRTLHTLHRQAYNIAYDTALMAQQALEHERGGIPDIIQSNNWNADRAGLMSGEQLMLQIQQLERKYEELNTRELELTKHISLNQLHPFALLELRETGKCNFAIPEELFDLDFPGHFYRRIKSVSITIPCVAGPYTTINATLRMSDNKIRKKPDRTSPTEPVGMPYDTSKIAVSSAQNDAGLFELNFRDERYLPFEGAGAVSGWELELMQEKSLRQFDYNTIADVIVHLRYTAREDGGLKEAVINNMKSNLNALKVATGTEGLFRLFSLRYDFPNEWHAWTKQNQPLSIKLEKHHFPYFAQMGTIAITSVQACSRTADEIAFDAPVPTPAPQLQAGAWDWIPGDILAREVEIQGTMKRVEDWFVLVKYQI